HGRVGDAPGDDRRPCRSQGRRPADPGALPAPLPRRAHNPPCALRRLPRRTARARGDRMTKKAADPFWLGGLAALEAFEIELIQNRDNVEAAPEPTVEVILDLLHRVTEEIRARPTARRAR